MAGQNAGSVERRSPLGSPEAKAKAAATRTANKKLEVALGDDLKFAVTVLEQASKSCKALAQKIRRGGKVTPGAVRAASDLTAEAGSAMFS